ncbi:MAG: hypothetical protein V6Z78_04990 [Holosporaceae bacterium]
MTKTLIMPRKYALALCFVSASSLFADGSILSIGQPQEGFESFVRVPAPLPTKGELTALKADEGFALVPTGAETKKRR